MNRLIILLYILILISCREKSKENTVSRKCSVSIALYGAPWDDQFTALYNYEDKYGDSLIVAKHYKTNEKDTSIYKRVMLNSLDKDTLYEYFTKIKNNFQLTDKQSNVADGTKVRISISSPTNAVSYVYSGLKDAESADPEIGKLIKFINRKLPKNFQMY